MEMIPFSNIKSGITAPPFDTFPGPGTGSFIKNYQLIEELGRGHYSTVFKGQSPKKTIAVKRIKMMHYDKKFQGSLNILMKLQKIPFVLKLMDYTILCDHVYLLTTYCPGGNLDNLAYTLHGLSETYMKFYSMEIVSAFIHIHKSKHLYLNLKSTNVLIDSKGHVRLANFNYAETFEKAKSAGHVESIDWWSLGFLWMELVGNYKVMSISGERRSRLYSWLNVPSPYRILSHCSTDAKDFVRDMLGGNVLGQTSKKRDVRGHQFFKGVNWKKVNQGKISPPYVPSTLH